MSSTDKNSGNVSEGLLKAQEAQEVKEAIEKAKEELTAAYEAEATLPMGITEAPPTAKAIPRYNEATAKVETMDEMVARLNDDPRVLKRKLNKAHLQIDLLEEHYNDVVEEFNSYILRVNSTQATIATLLQLANDQMERVAPVGERYRPHHHEKFDKEASM